MHVEVRDNRDDLVAKLLAENARLMQAVAQHGVILPAAATPKDRLRPPSSPAPTVSSNKGSPGPTTKEALDPRSQATKEALDLTRSQATKATLDPRSPATKEALDPRSQATREALDPRSQHLPEQALQHPKRPQALQNSHPSPARSNLEMHQKRNRKR